MIFIGLGSSIGNASQTFTNTETFLATHKITVLKKSKVLKNPPLGGVAKNEFSNAVWELNFPETLWEKANWALLPSQRRLYLKAKKLLKNLQACEKYLGRVREKRWDDRTLDLDILQFFTLQCSSKKLTIPHSELINRQFVLLPWGELVDKNFKIPTFGLLRDLINKSETKG